MVSVVINVHDNKMVCEIDHKDFGAVFLCKNIDECKEKAYKFIREKQYDGQINMEYIEHGSVKQRTDRSIKSDGDSLRKRD